MSEHGPEARPTDISVALLMPSDLVRGALAMVIGNMPGVAVVATSWSLAVGAQLVGRYSADVVIVDTEFEALGEGASLIRRIRPQARIIVLAGSPIELSAEHVMAARPEGFAFKRHPSADLEKTIKLVMKERESRPD